MNSLTHQEVVNCLTSLSKWEQGVFPVANFNNKKVEPEERTGVFRSVSRYWEGAFDPKFLKRVYEIACSTLKILEHQDLVGVEEEIKKANEIKKYFSNSIEVGLVEIKNVYECHGKKETAKKVEEIYQFAKENIPKENIPEVNNQQMLPVVHPATIVDDMALSEKQGVPQPIETPVDLLNAGDESLGQSEPNCPPSLEMLPDAPLTPGTEKPPFFMRFFCCGVPTSPNFQRLSRDATLVVQQDSTRSTKKKLD